MIGLVFRESLESIIESQQVVVGLGRGRFRLVEVHAGAITAALELMAAAGILDQDSSHGLSRGGKEMTTAIPRAVRIAADQTQIRLVNECCRL